MISNEQKLEFFDRLYGKDGCDFNDKEMTWKCYYDHRLSKKILNDMNINIEDQKEILSECEVNGGHCDCEIIFNCEGLFVDE